MNPEACPAALTAAAPAVRSAGGGLRRAPGVRREGTPAALALPAVLLGLVGLAGLAGCAAPPAPGSAGALVAGPAASAVSGPSARLLLRGAVPADDRFAVFVLGDALACKDPRMLIAGTPQKTPDPATLPAGVLTTLDFVILRGGKPGCFVRWSFTPQAGKTYLVQGLVVGGGCTARLFDASAPDRPVPAADAVLRSTGGQACLPLAQARANAAAGGSLIQGGQHNGEAVLNPRATAKDLEGLIRP